MALKTASVNDIVEALVLRYTFTIDNPQVATPDVIALNRTPGSLDAYHLPCLYLWRVGAASPDLTQGDGHSTETGTFVRDFEFHAALSTINQQDDEKRNILNRLILDELINRWLTTYDLKDAGGNYLPYVSDWWYTGDQGLGLLSEFGQKYLGSALTFRVRYLWIKEN